MITIDDCIELASSYKLPVDETEVSTCIDSYCRRETLVLKYDNIMVRRVFDKTTKHILSESIDVTFEKQGNHKKEERYEGC